VPKRGIFMDERFLAKRYQNMVESPLSAVSGKAKSYDDLINFGLGDPDLHTDEGIIRYAFQKALEGHTHYTDPRGMPELRQEIANYYAKDFGITVDDKEIFVTASASAAMHIALEAILNEGEEVIMISPYFSSYHDQIILARGVPVEYDTYFEEGFQVNIERLERCVNEKTRAIIVNTPNNPTGNCLSRKSLEDIASLARKYDLIVVADDIYTIFSYQEEFIPLMSLEGMRERTITINSFSKNFLMTGWRLGNVIAPDYIIHAMRVINDSIVYSAPSVSQCAGIYALQHRHEICPPIAEEYRRRLEYAANRINSIPNMAVIAPPGGTFYLFVDIRKTNLSSQEVCRILLEEAHVLTIPGYGFGRCGEGFLRIACTMGIEKMKEAFDRIEKVSIFQKEN